MKINTRKSHKRKAAVIIALIVLLAIGGSAYAYIRFGRITPTSDSSATLPNSPEVTEPTVNLAPPTVDQQAAAEEQKKQSLENTSTSNTSSTLPVTITRANQNSSTLQIGTMIEKVTNTGSCTLTLRKGDQTVSRTSNIQAGPNNSTCQGFDVPITELSTGTWTIKVDVVSGEVSGSASSEVTINAA